MKEWKTIKRDRLQRRDFLWYKKNLKKLYEQYGEQYVAIKNKKVIGVYPTGLEGVLETGKREKPGTFIVQKCGPDESAYTYEYCPIFVAEWQKGIEKWMMFPFMRSHRNTAESEDGLSTGLKSNGKAKR